MRANQPDLPSERHRRWAVRAYAILLWLYPPAHRRSFGQSMLRTFNDHYRDVVEAHRESPLRFWLGQIGDVGRSLPREYVLAVHMALRSALGEWTNRRSPMKTAGWAVLAMIAGLLLLLGLRVWLSPAMLSAPHGGGTAWSSAAGLALLVLVYALVTIGLLRARRGVGGSAQTVALRRATLVGALLGGGALVAIAVDTFGDFQSSLSGLVWELVIVAAPLGWGVAGLLATRAGSSWRLGVVAALWSGMVSALLGAVGEVASTVLALPRLVQHELSNPDYLAWHQPDIQSYAIASALAVGVIGLLLAPVIAAIAGGIGSKLGKAASPVARLE